MPVTVNQMIEQMNHEGNGGSNAAIAGLKAYFERKQAEREAGLAGDKQKAVNEANLNTLSSPKLQDLVNEGGSVKAGDLSVGGNPYAKMQMQGPHQAQAFLKTAQGAYKGINDQLDSSKATLDNLNLGNSTGDKLALINEAKLSLAGSGGRAIGQMVSQLSGDPTMASDAQKSLNWLQNTPNVPTLQPAQRDAMREAVFGRLPQISQQHDQTSAQLAQQGPIVAPQADYSGLVNSFVTPTKQKIDQLGKMQADYQAQRAKMQPQPNVSNPSQANANPTTVDRLKSFFGVGSGGGQAQPQQAQQPADPIADELARRAKQSLNQPQQGQ